MAAAAAAVRGRTKAAAGHDQPERPVGGAGHRAGGRGTRPCPAGAGGNQSPSGRPRPRAVISPRDLDPRPPHHPKNSLTQPRERTQAGEGGPRRVIFENLARGGVRGSSCVGTVLYSCQNRVMLIMSRFSLLYIYV